MKMIPAGTANMMDYPLYSRNCNLNRCQKPYLVPIPSLADLQLFVNFGPNKPDVATFSMINLCTNAFAEMTTTCFKIGYNGSYWYGVFKKFDIDFSFPTFIVHLDITYENGDELTYFSEQYEFENTCDPLTKINVCYPYNYNAEDMNSIWVGQHDDTQPYSGKIDMFYQHNYWVRRSERIEMPSKITFVSNSSKTFGSTIQKIDELRYEFVPGWYKNYLTAVYFRGNFFINNEEVKATDLAYENIFEGADLWKAYVRIEKETKGAFGCAPITCPPDECLCTPITLPDIGFPNALQDNPYSYTIVLGGTGPFEITSSTLPAWMTAEVVGSAIVFSGTPDETDVETGIDISVNVSNECSNADINDSINVVPGGEPFPFTVVLSRIDNDTLRAFFYGGTPPYDYAFGCIAAGSACAAYSFANPNGTTSLAFIDTDYEAEKYQNATYDFYCNAVDSLGATAGSNIVAEPECLVPETLILMNGGSKKKLGALKKDDILSGNNKVTSFRRLTVDRLYIINNGLLKTSIGHVNIKHDGNLCKSAFLKVGDTLTSELGAPVLIENIEVIKGNFEVINISTENKTYVANGILTHNKLLC